MRNGPRCHQGVVQHRFQLTGDVRCDQPAVDQLGQDLAPAPLHQCIPGLALVDGGQRSGIDGVQTPDHAAGVRRDFQQVRACQLRLQFLQRTAGAEHHGEVAPVPPIPEHAHCPDDRHRDGRVALQQLHQPALEGELRPERAVDLDDQAPVEDEHRVGVRRRRLDSVVTDALLPADRIDGRFPHLDVVEQRRPLRPGVDRRQQEGQNRSATGLRSAG